MSCLFTLCERMYSEHIDIVTFVNVILMNNRKDNIGLINFDINFDEDTHPYIESYAIGKCPKEKISEIIKLCNEVNMKHRWVKFYIDNDQTIVARADAIVNENSVFDKITNLVAKMSNTIDLAYKLSFKKVLCNNSFSIDYSDEVSFENAINNGEPAEGKTVRFVVQATDSNSHSYFIWAGKHLKFVLGEKVDAVIGQTITAKVIKAHKLFESWTITCEIIHDVSNTSETVVEKEQTVTAPMERNTTTEGSVVSREGQSQIIDELMDELNSLTGLKEVKENVSSLVNLIRVRKMREERGMKQVPVSLHLVFSGNPGTGKTTVARLLAQIYKELGVLSKGQLIEVDRSGLIASYLGQTPKKVIDVVEQAKGGILFIDEAYALTVNRPSTDYGFEAVDTLLKCMEDYRDDFIVIVAGYPEPMEQFLQSNPGLRSRFNRYITFSDYEPEELFSILEGFCKKAGYKLSEDAKEYTQEYLTFIYENRKSDFANGREVRNLFEHALAKQADRLASMTTMVSDEELLELKKEDFITNKPMENVASENEAKAEDYIKEHFSGDKRTVRIDHFTFEVPAKWRYAEIGDNRYYYGKTETGSEKETAMLYYMSKSYGGGAKCDHIATYEQVLKGLTYDAKYPEKIEHSYFSICGVYAMRYQYISKKANVFLSGFCLYDHGKIFNATYIDQGKPAVCIKAGMEEISKTIKIGEPKEYEIEKARKLMDEMALKVLHAREEVETTNNSFVQTIRFGRYGQFALSKNPTPIEWYVLDQKEGFTLLLSKKVLEAIPYNEQNAPVTWEISYARKWLNKYFLFKAFSVEEQKAIMMTNCRNTAERNPAYQTSAGKDTNDYIFLLSYDQTNRMYLTTPQSRLCLPTEHVAIKDPSMVSREGYCSWWWLRSPGMQQNGPCLVMADNGAIDYDIYDGCNGGIRPAMWVNTAYLRMLAE